MLGTMLDDAIDSGLSALGVTSEAQNPYMQKAKQSTTDFMNKPWLQGWQWAIEATGAPTDLDMYVKDVDFGFGSIDVDTVQVGCGAIAKPTFSGASEITATVRDDQERSISTWFGQQIKKVKNKDGTINLPKDYVFELRIFTLNDDGDRTLLVKYQVFAIKIGNFSFSRENGNQIHSFPIIFQKFSTVGNKVL